MFCTYSASMETFFKGLFQIDSPENPIAVDFFPVCDSTPDRKLKAWPGGPGSS